jgi:hypothetical protein
MNNYEFFRGMVNSTDLDKVFTIAAEEIFNAIPSDVMSEGMKGTIQAATKVIIPVVTGIYKSAFLSVYREEFSDEEFGKLLAHYGPGSVLWSFFNTTDFFLWLRKTIRECIQERIKGLDLASMSTEELQSLAQIGLDEILNKLPEWVKVGSADYLNSDLCKREVTLGDKITAKGNEAMAEINWYDLLEKFEIISDED